MDSSFNPFADGEILRAAPLTPEQEEIWLAIEIGGAEASLAYNEAVEVSLDGPLNIAALRTALAELVARHEALRLRFSGDGKSLLVYGSADVPLELVELAALDETTRATRVTEAGRAAVRRVFDLQKGPLLRAELLLLGERKHVLLLTAHHLVMDGWSGAMLVEELGRLYSAGVKRTRPGLEPAPQFSDHAVFRRKELAQFPLTPNGKIDRKALPAPEAPAGAVGEREPTTDTERRMVAEVAELLGLPRIGLDDDFFGLGGHVPLRTVFGRPTAGKIADFVEAALALRAGPARPATPVGEQEEILL